MRPKRFFILALLTLWLISTLFLASGGAFPAESVEGLANSYLFNLPRWETAKLWNELAIRLPRPGSNTAPAGRLDFKFVEEYFRLGTEIRALEARQERLAANSPNTEMGPDSAQIEIQLQLLRWEREVREAEVKAILARQIKQALAEEGIPALPPIIFTFDTPPQVLIISHRERIELKQALLVGPELSPAQAAKLEKQIEALPPQRGGRWGVSALVEDLGGLALYPSLIPETASLEQAIPAIAHEWVHQYLFFRPLGRRYGASYEMTTINETVANMVGDEIGDRALGAYGRSLKKSPAKGSSGFGFDQEMKRTRLRVDELLSRGQVQEAESYMEESRQLLAREGYYLRRLNQAYFAFHGSYADTSASTSPVAGWLRAIRQKSASVGEFLRTVAQITSYGELERLALQ